jgi:hypothetical protein
MMKTEYEVRRLIDKKTADQPIELEALICVQMDIRCHCARVFNIATDVMKQTNVLKHHVKKAHVTSSSSGAV